MQHKFEKPINNFFTFVLWKLNIITHLKEDEQVSSACPKEVTVTPPVAVKQMKYSMAMNDFTDTRMSNKTKNYQTKNC